MKQKHAYGLCADVIHHGDIVVGRVSAASTTARWSSRVGSTEHPESRSYLSDNSKGTGPLRLQDRE